MRIGTTMADHFKQLNESASIKVDTLEDKNGLVIPDTNKKPYEWLKKEYDKAKQCVDYEFNIGDSDFEPHMDLQTPPKSVIDFKPGMFGNKTTTKVVDGSISDFKPTYSKENTSFKEIKTTETDETSDTTDTTDEENAAPDAIKKEKREFKFDLTKNKKNNL